jgi:hypothetical protein
MGFHRSRTDPAGHRAIKVERSGPAKESGEFQWRAATYESNLASHRADSNRATFASRLNSEEILTLGFFP